ncbi:response regulator [Desulfococcaceae bacterium HSG9]|nr:response regulator [Desulfococcaceae bacterium HSG9]
MIVFFCEECGGRNVLDPKILNTDATRIRCQVCKDQIPLNQISADTSKNIINTTNYKILLVDDDPFSLKLLYTLLKSDYKLVVALNGIEAIKLATESKPDLILLDVMMPDMDGYEVCRKLKTDVKTRHIPIIFVSSMDEVTDEHRGLKAGAVDYIAKPISFITAQARIAIHLELKRQRDIYKKQVQKSNRSIKKLLQKSSDVMNTYIEVQKFKLRLEHASDAVDAIILLQNAAKQIVWVNETACKTFQMKRAELIGKYCYEIFHGSDMPCDNCPELQTLIDAYAKPVEARNIKMNKTFMLRHSPLFDEAGEFIGGVHVAKEISGS